MTRFAVVAMVLLAACGAPNGAAGGNLPPPPDGPPYIQGTVTSVIVTSLEPPETRDTADTAPGRILVEAAGGGNQAVLTIAADTAVWERFGGGLEPSRFSRIAEGHTVSAWVSGPVAESFPVQATADAIVIDVE